MHIDRYVKIILTIIAVELLWIGLKDGATPVVAQAQRAPTSVVIPASSCPAPRPASCRWPWWAATADSGRGARGRGSADHRSHRRTALRVETERPLDVDRAGHGRVTAERPLRVESVPYTPSKGPGE